MGKKPRAKKPKSTQHELIRCDLEFPPLQLFIASLETGELEQVFSSVEKISEMTWQQIYNTSSKTKKRGINWEPLGQRTASGAPIASIRVSGKFRARVTRDGVFMRFISLHPDHDSAYKEVGGEDV